MTRQEALSQHLQHRYPAVYEIISWAASYSENRYIELDYEDMHIKNHQDLKKLTSVLEDLGYKVINITNISGNHPYTIMW